MIEYIRPLSKGGPKVTDQKVKVAHLISAPSSKKRFNSVTHKPDPHGWLRGDFTAGQKLASFAQAGHPNPSLLHNFFFALLPTHSQS